MRYVVYPAMIKAGLARHDLEYYNDAELAAMEIKPWKSSHGKKKWNLGTTLDMLSFEHVTLWTAANKNHDCLTLFPAQKSGDEENFHSSSNNLDRQRHRPQPKSWTHEGWPTHIDSAKELV